MDNPTKPAIGLKSSDSAELHMVERCIYGEKDAWESLFHRYQPRLLAIIRKYLGPRAESGDLDAEEIAASIWYSLLVGNSARLRRYDPSRGTKLLTYLAALRDGDLQAVSPRAKQGFTGESFRTAGGDFRKRQPSEARAPGVPGDAHTAGTRVLPELSAGHAGGIRTAGRLALQCLAASKPGHA